MPRTSLRGPFCAGLVFGSILAVSLIALTPVRAMDRVVPAADQRIGVTVVIAT
jgi:hypothetical protein